MIIVKYRSSYFPRVCYFSPYSSAWSQAVFFFFYYFFLFFFTLSCFVFWFCFALLIFNYEHCGNVCDKEIICNKLQTALISFLLCLN